MNVADTRLEYRDRYKLCSKLPARPQVQDSDNNNHAIKFSNGADLRLNENGSARLQFGGHSYDIPAQSSLLA